jgi:hypothetical protein
VDNGLDIEIFSDDDKTTHFHGDINKIDNMLPKNYNSLNEVGFRIYNRLVTNTNSIKIKDILPTLEFIESYTEDEFNMYKSFIEVRFIDSLDFGLISQTDDSSYEEFKNLDMLRNFDKNHDEIISIDIILKIN